MANNCISIEFYNLSQAAQTRFGMDKAFLDITNADALRLTKNVESLTVANKIQTEGVLPFDAPSNDVNDAIFIEYLTPTVLDNRREYYDVRVKVAGHSLPFTRLVVTGIPQSGGGTWSLELRRSPDHWLELAGTKKLNTIDFGTFTLNRTNINTNWVVSKWTGAAGEVPYIWPLMDYGGWIDRTLSPNDTNITKYKAAALEDLRPLVSWPYLLKQGFCDIGWTLDGVIFDTEFVQGLYSYLLSETYWTAGEPMYVSVLSTVDNGTSGSPLFPFYSFDTLDFANIAHVSIPASNIFLPSVENVLKVEFQYTFEFSAVVNNVSASEMFFRVQEVEEFGGGIIFGEVYSDDIVIDLNSGDNDVFVQVSVNLPPEKKATLIPNVGGAPVTIKAGARGKAYPSEQSFYTGQEVTIKNAIHPNYILLNEFKAFCHLLRLQIETDEITKTVTLHPKKAVTVHGEKVAGFLLDELPSTEISELVQVGSEQVKVVNTEQTRYLELGYKDSTDAYIDSLELVSEPYRRKILNSELLPDGVTEVYNPVYEPTIEGGASLLATGAANRQPSVILPRLWDNVEGKRSFAIASRLFYAYGKVKQANPYPTDAISEYSSFFLEAVPNNLNTGLVQEFGYASMLPTWPLEPTPSFYGNLVFKKDVYNYRFTPNIDPDLFSTFYLNITNELRGGFDIDLLMKVTPDFYAKANFRQLYRLMYRGRPLNAQMRQIRDFVPCSEGITPVTFFIEPMRTECCELPCGCQFSTCEYYQDFGRFMTQTTLDALSVTTFDVDGISVIDTPLSFGKMKIVNVLGKPFVTNLVDTLNSVGAPYMTFGIAYRLDSLRGARFFTVKRPVCQAFKIEISNGENVVYRYTDELQEQAWFGSGFSPLGYGANEYSEPQNCIVTTEY